MKIGLGGPQDLLPLLVRRKWWVAIPFLILSSAACVVVYILPGIFVSETLILVRPRDVPEQFVMDLIADSAQQRLTAIEQTLRTRTNLLQVLRQFEDRLNELKPLNVEAKIDRLNRQIKITFQLEQGKADRQVLTSFKISYSNQDPLLAQEITSKLTTLFIEQDHRVRESQVFGTTQFLSGELQKIAEQLTESEKQLTTLKTASQFELPGQLETNLRTLDRLAVQRQTNAEALDRYNALRLNLERQLSQTPEFATQGPASPGQPAIPAPPANPQLEEYRKAQAEYDQLLASMLTPKHPEVLAAKARLDRLSAELPSEVLDEAPQQSVTAHAQEERVPNQLYQSLITQLQEVKTESAIRERERRWIDSEVEKYNHRVENTPQTEQRVSEVLRRNADLQKQYDDLKGKLAEARLAESLEGRQRGSQFVVIDPANYPLRPSKPDKMILLVASILGSLAAAIGLAVCIDIALQRVWTRSEIETFWGTPVLIDVPQIMTDADLAAIRRKKYIHASSFAGATGVYGVFLYLVYSNHGFVLQTLDPLLQRVLYR